jgi:hypothetical protein
MLHGLKCTRRTGINIKYKALSDRSLVESVYSSFKRTKVFFNNITSNPLTKRENQKINTMLEPTNKLSYYTTTT